MYIYIAPGAPRLTISCWINYEASGPFSLIFRSSLPTIHSSTLHPHCYMDDLDGFWSSNLQHFFHGAGEGGEGGRGNHPYLPNRFQRLRISNVATQPVSSPTSITAYLILRDWRIRYASSPASLYTQEHSLWWSSQWFWRHPSSPYIGGWTPWQRPLPEASEFPW